MRPRPIASVRAWATLAVWLAAAVMGGPSITRGDDPPPLAGPSDGPALEGPAPIAGQPPARPAPAAPISPPSARARDDRPVLALPGVTVPPARPQPPAEPMPSSLGPTLEAASPLISPATPGSATALPSLPSSRFRGRVIESTPASPSDLLPPIDAPPSRTTRRQEGMTPPSAGVRRQDDLSGVDVMDLLDRERSDARRRADEAVEKEKLRDLPTSLPARRPTFFNRWTNPFGLRPPVDDDSAIRAEPRTDPAADTALKRRVEKQAVAAVGDRVRSLDVRVVGRSVTIQAHGARLLQRRAVKRALESLPGLSGYRAVVEVVD